MKKFAIMSLLVAAFGMSMSIARAATTQLTLGLPDATSPYSATVIYDANGPSPPPPQTTTFSISWDSSVTLQTVWYYNGGDVPNQGDSSLTATVQALVSDPSLTLVGKDVLVGSPSGATNTGTDGSVYAVHFDTQELIFIFSGATGITLSNFTANGLSNIVAFGAAVPLPPALVLFSSALVGMGILGRRRRKVEPVRTA